MTAIKVKCQDCRHLETHLTEKSPRYYQSYRCRRTFKYMDPFILRHCKQFHAKTQQTFSRIHHPGMP